MIITTMFFIPLNILFFFEIFNTLLFSMRVVRIAFISLQASLLFYGGFWFFKIIVKMKREHKYEYDKHH